MSSEGTPHCTNCACIRRLSALEDRPGIGTFDLLAVHEQLRALQTGLAEAAARQAAAEARAQASDARAEQLEGALRELQGDVEDVTDELRDPEDGLDAQVRARAWGSPGNQQRCGSGFSGTGGGLFIWDI